MEAPSAGDPGSGWYRDATGVGEDWWAPSLLVVEDLLSFHVRTQLMR